MSDETPTNQVKSYMVAASKLGARLFRRNVGMGWIGGAKKFAEAATIRVAPGDVLIRQARPFHNGTEGQYDMTGWQTVTITPDMVGTQIAQVVEIEAKQGSGRETKEQIAWGECVNRAGGKAGVARSLEDIARILG
jgi:hypothetical protein